MRRKKSLKYCSLSTMICCRKEIQIYQREAYVVHRANKIYRLSIQIDQDLCKRAPEICLNYSLWIKVSTKIHPPTVEVCKPFSLTKGPKSILSLRTMFMKQFKRAVSLMCLVLDHSQFNPAVTCLIPVNWCQIEVTITKPVKPDNHKLSKWGVSPT
jgi:hypothetical protein